MLSAAGELAVPEIKRVFLEEKDSTWNDWIILSVLRDWDASLITKLKTELLHLIDKPDSEGAATSALRILIEKGMLTSEIKESLYQQLRQAYASMHRNWGGDWWPGYQVSLMADLDELMQEAS